jgi:hypothetical protein
MARGSSRRGCKAGSDGRRPRSACALISHTIFLRFWQAPADCLSISLSTSALRWSTIHRLLETDPRTRRRLSERQVQGLEALFAVRAIAQQVDDVPTGCGHGGSNPNPVRRDRPLRRTSAAADCRSDPFRPTRCSTAKGSCDRPTGVVRGTESLLTLRWSGMDSNVQFRARWARH